MRFTILCSALAASATLSPGSSWPKDVGQRPATVKIHAANRDDRHSSNFEVDRAPDGLFYVRGTVKGDPIDFAVDSGASVVVLSPADARRLGLGHDAKQISAETAGGPTTMRRIRIERLKVGGRVLEDVDAVIAGNGMNVSLLGQSALSRFHTVTFKRDTARFE